ncbi:MAG: redox-regulated ATPase YchF [Anaerolineae bacterium]
MTLSMGIVGLPNVGKSTTFNALTRTQNAQAANYPFCTIESNKAIVPVPDARVEKLAQLSASARKIHTTIEFVDIAGLVEGASRGDGLGNRFLGNIRDADAILHVVRCFDDANVVHVSEKPDPQSDIEVINLELMLADLQQLERRIERLTRQAKGDKTLRPLLDMACALQAHLESGETIATFPGREDDVFHALNRDLRFLSAKPVIYAANVDEEGLTADNEYVAVVRRVAAEQGADVVKLCARMEEELAGFSDEEREEYLRLAGVAESGLEQIIHKSYHTLGLVSFFTTGEDETRAWTIQQGWTAPKAAGVIHTDFERGFICAEVIPYDLFVHYGSSAAVRAAGALRVEGKEYVVQDGDVILFRFNV